MSYNVHKHIDCGGKELSIGSGTIESCSQQCSNIPNCDGFTYKNDQCIFKTKNPSNGRCFSNPNFIYQGTDTGTGTGTDIGTDTDTDTHTHTDIGTDTDTDTDTDIGTDTDTHTHTDIGTDTDTDTDTDTHGTEGEEGEL